VGAASRRELVFREGPWAATQRRMDSPERLSRGIYGRSLSCRRQRQPVSPQPRDELLIVMSRLAGISLIALGVACWPGTKTGGGQLGPRFPTPNSQLPTPNFQLPTPNSQFPTPNFQLPISKR